MYDRTKLHKELETILGTKNVYFQPPEGFKMIYPCIVYERHGINNKHADDRVYLEPVRYRATVIDANPDSEIVHKMNNLKHARFVRHFAVNQLNHDIFDIY